MTTEKGPGTAMTEDERPMEFAPSAPPVSFSPSAAAQVPTEGRRDVAVVFLGDSLVAGLGDPKGQGWVCRVLGRTAHPDLELTGYPLGVEGGHALEAVFRLFQANVHGAHQHAVLQGGEAQVKRLEHLRVGGHEGVLCEGRSGATMQPVAAV